MTILTIARLKTETRTARRARVPRLTRPDDDGVPLIDALENFGSVTPQQPGGKPVPLTIGDTLELNDRRAVVVGIAKTTRTFQSQPVIYTTYNRALLYAPRERKLLSFVVVKAKPGQNLDALARRIQKTTGLAAYTQAQFKTLTYDYFMKNTGILIRISASG